jgi:hypothetical protein
MMKFTRREKIILVCFAVLYIVGMTVGQSALDRWEWLVPIFAIVLAWFITTDPQRKAGNE